MFEDPLPRKYTHKEIKGKGYATFLNPSRTPFRFSYLLKRSERDLSTELRSARACSFSKVSCWKLFWEVILVLCSSSVNHNQKQGYIHSTIVNGCLPGAKQCFRWSGPSKQSPHSQDLHSSRGSYMVISAEGKTKQGKRGGVPFLYREALLRGVIWT